jgi:sigma-B regulation protein RsbU (phosphoserine phosphatase)
MKRNRSRKPATPATLAVGRFEEAALFEFSKVINSSVDPNFIYSHILLTIMGKILSTRGMLLVKAGEKFVVQAVKGFPKEVVGEAIVVKRIPATLFSLDGITPGRYPWVTYFRSHDVKIVLPMQIAGKPIGLLAFGPRLASRKLQLREITFLRSLANISATAVEISRTVEELRQVNRELDRKIQELNTLFELGKEFGREFGALLERDKLVRLLIFSLLGQIMVNRYLICLKDGPDMTVVASRIDGQAPQSQLLNALTDVKMPTLVPDIVVRHAEDPRPVLGSLNLAVVVPMQFQGECKGLIMLGEKLSREPFKHADLELLFSLGNLAIISLENARLFKETLEKQRLEDELMIAREIQKGLLPAVLPVIHGVEIAATNISSKQVGGDYYDVIRLQQAQHIIAIGDVSGKGSPAALLMANLQATIRALVPLNLPLAELTERVNDLMCRNTGGNKFVTFFWGMLDSEGKTLSYVNAGHNYPFLFHADGSCDRLDRGGMILGVMKTLSPYEQATIPLRSQDLLVLFTDGVSEAMSKEGEEYGEERLETLLREHRSMNAQSVLEAVHRDVLAHTRGVPQSDDITMMVLRVL